MALVGAEASSPRPSSCARHANLSPRLKQIWGVLAGEGNQGGARDFFPPKPKIGVVWVSLDFLAFFASHSVATTNPIAKRAISHDLLQNFVKILSQVS